MSSLRVLSHERRSELKPVWDFIKVENLTSVFSQLSSCIHMNWSEMKLKTVWILYWSFWPKWNFKPAWDFHVNIIYPKRNKQAQTRWMLRLMRMCVWNSMPEWISYRSFWQKWNLISGNKILCKHYPKWNVHQNIGSFWNAAEIKLHVNRTCFLVGFKSQTGMSSFRLSCERTLKALAQYRLNNVTQMHILVAY